MAVRPSDTNPALSTEKIKEVIKWEMEIDLHLLEHLRFGKAMIMLTTSRDVIEEIIQRYRRKKWKVKIGYEGDFLFRLDFEDPAQTKNQPVRQKLIPPEPPRAHSGTFQKRNSQKIFVPISAINSKTK